MRQRSITIEDLSVITDSQTNCSQPLENQESTMLTLHHMQSYEKWVEGEYTATLKALEQAYNENNTIAANSLHKAILDLERRSSSETSEEINETTPSQQLITTNASEESNCQYSPSEKNKLEKILLQNIKQYDHLLNVMLIGESKSGKSSFIHTFIYGDAPTHLKETNGIEDKVIIKLRQKERVKYRIWDTDSNKKHEGIRKVYYNQSHAILLFFDITNRDSFNGLKFWVNSILTYTSKRVNCPLIYIIGNKIDLKENRRVSKKEATEFAKGRNLKYYEASSTGKYVATLFESLADELLFHSKSH